MKQQRFAWVGAVVAALVLGAIGGFAVLQDSGSTGGSDATIGDSSGITVPQTSQGDRMPPGFQNEVPVAVVEGVIVNAAKDSLTVRVSSLPYESPEFREKLAAVWPSVGGDLTVALVDAGMDVDAAKPGTPVLVLLNQRGSGSQGLGSQWLVQMVGVVDGEDVTIISDPSGRVDEQLGYIAGQLGESRYAAFVRIASELRDYRDEVLALGGDRPENPSPAVRAMLRFDRGATRAAKADEQWRAADPSDRDYEDAPKDVKAGLVEVHVFFEVDPGFIASDEEDSIVAIRDGFASGFAFRAVIGTIDEPILATPGRDLIIVLGTIEDMSGTVIGTIPSGEWETLDSILVTVSGSGNDVAARWHEHSESEQ